MTAATLVHPYRTEDHQHVHELVTSLAQREIVPLVNQLEALGPHTDREVRRVCSNAGLLGVLIGSDFGGMDEGHVSKTMILVVISRVSAAAGAILQASILGAAPIIEFGSEEMRSQWLPEIAAGRVWPTIASTDRQSGSYLRGMDTTARRRGREFILDGEKDLVGNVDLGDIHCVVARTGKVGDPRGLTAFLVETGTPGVEVIRRPVSGLRGFSVDGLRLTGVRVPRSHVIGEVGDGEAAALISSVVYGRLNLAAVGLGIQQETWDVTTRWVSERERRGGHLSDVPAVRRRIAEMAVRLRQAELAVFHAAYLLDAGEPCDEWLLDAKLISNRTAVASAEDAQHLHGGHAVRLENPIERLLRDVRLINAPAGPDDIQIKYIADAALGPSRTQWSVRHTLRRRS
ncbi:acyl-CoA dehydrogenase family protein [Streptomyces sp. XY66]|uniref:acyl-CoA dehydrogenase family protein n=1 Tax=Streptomyces sp. XY66 TaxID=1415563 RepID=UPI0006AEEE5B|nr:acyl-CoA dehydrogenase family protein [Streptomyces sp. XY66]